MITFPGPIDSEILDEMRTLETVIVFHKKVQELGKTVEYFLPKEISYRLKESNIQKVWDIQDYSTIRTLYSEFWIDYYESLFGDEIYFERSYYTEKFKTI